MKDQVGQSDERLESLNRVKSRHIVFARENAGICDKLESLPYLVLINK